MNDFDPDIASAILAVVESRVEGVEEQAHYLVVALSVLCDRAAAQLSVEWVYDQVGDLR